uniref:Uncharacterized protein n=1 Tax=Candidatus Kentrum sp. UNK TaxID=2126344 RepID=A0A451B0A1_9GAMM|nr:MAG: hypothetical protein BECKUNK1418G_GA0071005_107714 [Candidatus Kentron sp. UNK]VFK71699.1 MAG: hypothetical protein BECKUNK1418H_GA0071006_10794 [Candidatus Kentron sp. UNK]
MEFFSGFSWAVPKAFKNAVASCSFEEGDTFYSTKAAYGAWGEAIDRIEAALQVHLPDRTVRKEMASSSLPKTLFEKNWHGRIKVEFIRGARYRDEYLHTTQGRLFMLLRAGDLDVLDMDHEEPEPPLFHGALKRHLGIGKTRIPRDSAHAPGSTPSKKENLIEEIKQKAIRYPGRAYENPNFIILAHNEVNNIAVGKFNAIIDSLHGFDSEVIDLAISDLPSLQADRFHPTVSVRIIIVDSNSPEKIRGAINKALWPKKEPAEISHHLVFMPFRTS